MGQVNEGSRRYGCQTFSVNPFPKIYFQGRVSNVITHWRKEGI